MFLSISFILMVSSFSIYSIVMIATPQTYQIQANQRFSTSVNELIEKLKTVTQKDADKLIVDFCIEYRAVAELKGGNDKKSYGNFSNLQQSSMDKVGASLAIATTVQFADSSEIYSFTLSQMDKVENEMMLVFLRLLPWIILIIFMISIIGSLVCSRILAKPVLKISRISKRMSDLDMTWHCDIQRTDEVGVLANSLNIMSQKLNTTMTELENANRQLQLDIEKEKSQEKQRRAFFAAVSHELKTPITILKGQIESMIYQIGDYKNKEKYLPASLETVERMENLVKEILTISQLTADGFKLITSPIDLKRLVDEIVNIYRPLFMNKNIELDTSKLENVTIEVNKKFFEKVLSNVINNAMLYTPEGGKVMITLQSHMFTVVNTQTHIPEEKLPDLFAPLTRVEESRNQYTGGSGLGLYIVKTVLDLHKFPFDLHNIENGVQFCIYLHRNQN